MSNQMTIYVDLEPSGLEYNDDPQAILIYTDNVTSCSGPSSKVVHSVKEIGPVVQEMVEFNVRNMIANAEEELVPITEEKSRLEKWLKKDAIRNAKKRDEKKQMKGGRR